MGRGREKARWGLVVPLLTAPVLVLATQAPVALANRATAGAWVVRRQVAGDGFSSVSCASRQLCAATTPDGHVLISTDPDVICQLD
jgi:hypothetical protein